MAIGLAIAGFQVASGFLSSRSSKRAAKRQARYLMWQAEGNAKISENDAEIARQEAKAIEYKTAFDMMNHMEMAEEVLGTQIASYGKSGVVVSTGSALDVQVETARRGAMDTNMILWEGKKAATRMRNTAMRYEMLADYGLRDAAVQASAIRASGNDQARAYMLQGISSGLNTYASTINKG